MMARGRISRLQRWVPGAWLCVAAALVGCSAMDDGATRCAQDERDLKVCQVDRDRANAQVRVCEQSLGKAAEAIPQVKQLQGEIELLVPQQVRAQVNDRVMVLVRSIGMLAQQNEQASAERRHILRELTTAKQVQARLDAKEQEIKTLRADLEARAQALDERSRNEQQAIARQAASLIDGVRAFDERIDCKGCSEPVAITGVFRRHEEAKKAILDFHRHLLEELSGLALGAPAESPSGKPGS